MNYTEFFCRSCLMRDIAATTICIIYKSMTITIVTTITIIIITSMRAGIRPPLQPRQLHPRNPTAMPHCRRQCNWPAAVAMQQQRAPVAAAAAATAMTVTVGNIIVLVVVAASVKDESNPIAVVATLLQSAVVASI